MTIAGWIIMLVSIGTVSALFLWCFYKVLKTPGETERLRGFEIETPDEKTEETENDHPF